MGAGESQANTNLLMDIGVTDYRTELVKRDLAVLVLVGEQNGLVDDLLQLRVLQVIADHHL